MSTLSGSIELYFIAYNQDTGETYDVYAPGYYRNSKGYARWHCNSGSSKRTWTATATLTLTNTGGSLSNLSTAYYQRTSGSLTASYSNHRFIGASTSKTASSCQYKPNNTYTISMTNTTMVGSSFTGREIYLLYRDSYDIKKNLLNCTLSNSVDTCKLNESFSTKIVPNDYFSLDTATISIKLNGVDITETAYNSETNEIIIPSVTGDVSITALTTTSTIFFKPFYRGLSLIGSGTYKFRPYTVAEPAIGDLLTTSSDEILQDGNGNYLEYTSLYQLAAPQNVTADGTTVSWDAVEHAENYDIYADGIILGIVLAATDELAGTWVFNDNPDLSGSGAISVNINFTSNEENFTLISIIKGSIGRGEINYDEFAVHTRGMGWPAGEAYKTITITSKLSEVTDGDTLLTWLRANATKQ